AASTAAPLNRLAIIRACSGKVSDFSDRNRPGFDDVAALSYCRHIARLPLPQPTACPDRPQRPLRRNRRFRAIEFLACESAPARKAKLMSIPSLRRAGVSFFAIMALVPMALAMPAAAFADPTAAPAA